MPPSAPALFDWPRFWCPREGRFSLSDRGYLVDPTGDMGQYINKDVVGFNAFSEVACLVLLGEAGIGKSTAVNAIASHLAAGTHGAVRQVDLGAYASEDRLERVLLAENDTVEHLFLDGLDESPLPSVARLLASLLERLARPRLSIRITCRTGSWLPTLEEALVRTFGDPRVYELVPLRRLDVEHAAARYGLDAPAFLEAVERHEAVPLAIKPITLRFLLGQFRTHGHLPSTQTALYGDGLRLLCEEMNENRVDAGITGSLDADQRMAIAERMAAITIFSAGPAIWTAPDPTDAPPGDVQIRQLLEGEESAHGRPLPVTQPNIKEILSTGLFTSRGPHRFGWAHHSYAEFLAASFLARRGLSDVQLKGLLFQHDAHAIPAQLKGVAAWLGSMSAGIGRALLALEPTTLLRGDIRPAPAGVKKQLATALLHRAEQGVLHSSDLDSILLAKLACPDLDSHIQATITDRTQSAATRGLAIDMVEAAGLGSTEPSVVALALDPTEHPAVRKDAAFAVSRAGSTAAKLQLKPLAFQHAGPDAEDELKGIGLWTLWPENLSAIEVFGSLTYPRRESLYGMYKLFLHQALVERLREDDLPIALRWVALRRARYDCRPFDDVIDDVLRRALEGTPTSQTFVDACATAIVSRLYRHDRVLEPSRDGAPVPALDDDLRRAIVAALVAQQHPEFIFMDLIWSSPPLVVPTDVVWLLGRLSKASSSEQWRYSLLLRALMMQAYDALLVHWDAIIAAAEAHPQFAECCKGWLGTVELGSAHANELRGRHEQYMAITEERLAREKQQQERAAAAVAKARKAVEASDLLSVLDALDEVDRSRDFVEGNALVEAEVLADRRDLLLDSAVYFLSDTKWNGVALVASGSATRAAFAGYNALRLIAHAAAGRLHHLTDDAWTTWAPVVVWFSAIHPKDGLQRRLAAEAHARSPQTVLSTIVNGIRGERSLHNVLSVLDVLDWDDTLAEHVAQAAGDATLPDKAFGPLIEQLYRHTPESALVAAQAALDRARRDPSHEPKAVEAGRVLLALGDSVARQIAWSHVIGAAALGRAILSALAVDFEEMRDPRIAGRLSEEELAAWYEWLEREFPATSDPDFEGAHLGPRDHIGLLRNRLLVELQNRATPRAVAEMRRLVAAFPQLPYLPRVLAEAETRTLAQTWKPFTPQTLLTLAEDRRRRLVSNGDQLLDVLVESLGRLQQELQGETPMAHFLWDSAGQKPLDENRLSDWVKTHLDRDLRNRGIILNREVEIRRSWAPGTGERTDIHVDAVAPADGDYARIKVIVETKGCWHAELDTAMETQLRDRYLKENDCRHGLYLVGWYDCARTRQNGRCGCLRSRQESQQFFDAQSMRLSAPETTLQAFVLDCSLQAPAG